jgi:hypothetical protein
VAEPIELPLSAPSLLTAIAGAPFSILTVLMLWQWFADRRDRRNAAQAQVADQAVGRTLSLVDQLQEELARANAGKDAVRAEIELLRAARWQLEDRWAEVREAAIAARAMVHDLQRCLGEDLTEFPPLSVIGGRSEAETGRLPHA